MAKKVMKNEVKIKSIERPLGVTILAVLGYIGAVATLLVGLVLIFFSAALASMLTNIPSFETAFGVIGAALFIVLGIIFLPLAVLDYFIARGLWRGQNWARILLLIFAGLGVLQGIIALPMSILSLAIDALIVWYIGFNKPVVAYFK